MRFCLIHVEGLPRPQDEAAVIVPGGEPVAIMVPVCELGEFLPLLHEATRDIGRPCCDGCGEPLPGRRP